MLPTSRLLSFINHQTGFSLNFLEGSRLIEDIALLHAPKLKGFSYLRDFVLMGEHLTSYLKHQESMGIFIDSETPYLRLKLEISAMGDTRTLLLPEQIEDIPTTINGYCRLVKVNPFQSEPYTSFIRVENIAIRDAITLALMKSYQVESHLSLSSTTDQSIMLSRLPDIQVDRKVRETRIDLEGESERIYDVIEQIYQKQTTDEGEIQKLLSTLDYEYITGRDIKLTCNCEHQRMVSGIASLAHSESLDGIFEGDESLEVRCDYCKTNYNISRLEVQEFIKNRNS